MASNPTRVQTRTTTISNHLFWAWGSERTEIVNKLKHACHEKNTVAASKRDKAWICKRENVANYQLPRGGETQEHVGAKEMPDTSNNHSIHVQEN